MEDKTGGKTNRFSGPLDLGSDVWIWEGRGPSKVERVQDGSFWDLPAPEKIPDE